jgi:hypothetical protein
VAANRPPEKVEFSATADRRAARQLADRHVGSSTRIEEIAGGTTQLNSEEVPPPPPDLDDSGARDAAINPSPEGESEANRDRQTWQQR